MKFYTPFDRKKFPGEINSGELITEPGQAFSTREIYERFIRTGRVEGVAKSVLYDTDNVEDSDLDNLTQIDRPLDLTDIDDKMNELYRLRTERIAQAQREELAKRTASQGSSAANDAVSSSKGE